MKARETAEGSKYYYIKCPGCGDTHTIDKTRWSFNGNFDKPTFTPSLLVRSGHFAPHFKEEDGCWCTYNIENPESEAPFHCVICHSHITDGKIQFLSDCTHALAGQTVELPELCD
jgi:hypothetical protein